MANDNKEISEIVKKCKILLLDIEGTTTSISFVKDKLFPYAEENVKQFLDNQWETDDVKEVVAALRKLALEDQEKSVDGVVVIPGEDASKEEQIEGLVNNVKWQMSSDRKEGALKKLQGLIWKQGYDSGDIKGHVYDDVSPALEQWHSVEGQKVYIYSSGSIQAQKLLFGQSQAGDLLRFIDGHFDTAVGAKQEATSYTAISKKIGVPPADVLFLTDIPKEGEAARVAGLHVALVSREGNAPLSTEATDAFVVLHSLAQLTASNKRKTEPQDEQPAKVPKTDADVDVKTVSASVVVDEKVPEKKVENEQEKMEVEESPLVEDAAEKENNVDQTVLKIETVIEETDSIEPLDVPMADVESAVIKDAEKDFTDIKPLEKGVEETETTKSVEVDTKLDEIVAKPVDSAITDELITKSNEIALKPNEGVTKPEQVIKKPDEVVVISEEIINKTDEAKAGEVLETSKVSLANETKESSVVAKSTENVSKKIDEQKEETVNSTDEIEKEEDKVAEETPPAVITEIEEITAENLGDVAEIIDDLEPVVEEPPNEDMEDLRNVGEVLEKECDEILSKVQDVTNLDSIPLKPLLNPIVEEAMETELDADNMDSNDIVERILDTELELEMKQCNDIDPNTVSEITDDAKMEESVESKLIDDNKKEIETNATIQGNVTENSKEVSSAPESMDMESTKKKPEAEDNEKNNDKVENNESKEISEKGDNNGTVKSDNCGTIETNDNAKTIENVVCKEEEIKEKLDKKDETQNTEQCKEKMDTKDNAENKDLLEKSDSKDKMETNNKIEETLVSNSDESNVQSSENNVQPSENKDGLKTIPESADTGMISEGVTTECEKDKESQVNGKATNGEAETVNVNGDASNSEELSSRLSVENGKETVNGSNGDSVVSEKGQGDKVEAEVSDIKVKTVATEEPRTDPIEQPSEA